MKFIKIALIIAFSFISLQGIAPSIKNLCTIKQTHTIKKQGFNRDESEYIDLGNKYFYLTDNKHFTIEELYIYMEENSIFNIKEYKDNIITYDSYSSSSSVGVFYLNMELLDYNNSYYKINFTIIVVQNEDESKYEVVPYDENIDYTELNPISITITNERLLTLKELFSLITAQGIFDFDEYISLHVHLDTYSSSKNECGNYLVEISLKNVVEDDFSLKINVIVTQSTSISSSSSASSSEIILSTSSTSTISSSASISTSSSEEIEYTKLNTITVEVYNDRVIPLFELYDIIEKQGIFKFSEYLEVIAYYDTYSQCNKKVGVYYVDVHMINVVEDTFEMRIQIIVRQNRSYDSSSSSYSSSSSSSSSYSLSYPSSNESSSPSSSSSSSSSNESSSPINLPIVYVEIYNHRLLTLDEIFSEIQRQGLFDFYNYTNRTVTEDNYSSSQNRVGIHRIYLLLEDKNNNLSNLEIFVIVKQDRSSNDVIPITSLTFDEEEYTILDSIKVDLTNKEFMNLYRLCDYITQKRIHNFDEYLQILPIRDTYSSSELKDGTYYIDCELINVVEDTFIITIEINIGSKNKSSSKEKKNFFENIFESIKNIFINIFNSIKNIFKK